MVDMYPFICQPIIMTTKTIKRLPCGISDFGRLITENYACVDKTRYIEQSENENNPAKLIEIAKEGGVSAEVVSKFSIDNLSDNDYFISLLFYMGLLTIGEKQPGNLTRLCIPNYSIRTVYWEYILRLTCNMCLDIVYDHSKLNQAILLQA
jgi:hypothetical protein